MSAKSKFKILYVDDEPINLESFQLAFMFDKNFEIITAISGFEGLKRIQEQNQIHAIISDMRMPGMDGLSFIKKVKEINSSIPCLILSGYEETDETIEALDKGIIVDYIMKPFDITELEKCLLNLVNVHK